MTDQNSCHSIAKHKFLYPAHSEAKQLETFTFGVEKGLWQGQARRMGGLCSKTPSSPMVLRDKLPWSKFGMGATGCVTFF